MTTRSNTEYDKDRDRWYRLPNAPVANYAGVTSVLKARNKEGINRAKVNATARYAAKHRKTLVDMTQAEAYALLRKDDVTLPDWGVARDFGTRTHGIIENLIQGRPLDYGIKEVQGTESYPVDNDAMLQWAPQWWAEFNEKFVVDIVKVEQTVYSHKYGYAGSLDLLAYIDGTLTIFDLKTNKGGPRGDVALQNVAYSKADVMVDPVTGVEEEMPVVEQSAVLWMRPEGWAYFPLRFDEEVWRTFYAHLLAFKWNKIGESEAMQPKIAGNLNMPKRWNQ